MSEDRRTRFEQVRAALADPATVGPIATGQNMMAGNCPEAAEVFVDPHGRLWKHVRDEKTGELLAVRIRLALLSVDEIVPGAADHKRWLRHALEVMNSQAGGGRKARRKSARKPAARGARSRGRPRSTSRD